ncbi:MAG: XRE family transcriptional regulator [Nocardiopsaceae bacterium]|jgi:transcriptional regulator with XRE-family HTH domain|nr:XRE family transcriptional regulator [Nocardiopsaceae bacterium]
MRIGEHLRASRLARRLTVAEVAERSGLTKGFISKLEREQASASVASLARLCEALGISLGSLFQGPAGNLVRRGAYPTVNLGGESLTEYALTPHGERRVQAILSEIEPGGGSGSEPYSLPADVEFVFVLAGKLLLTYGEHEEHEVTLAGGDAFTFPPHSPHSFRAISRNGPTRVLWVVCPGLPADGNGRLSSLGTRPPGDFG